MSFDKGIAIQCANLSGKSYYQPSFSKYHIGFLIEYDSQGNQYLAFPGSEQIRDWFDDVEFVKVKRAGLGWIHNGFADTWDELEDEVIKRIDKTKPLYVTGHSLGGAIACVAALSLFNSGVIIAGVYTFGQPRVGNIDWYIAFANSKIELYRVKNGNDIVTTVPRILFWRHVGNEVHINRRGFSWFMNSFLDHKLENYLRSLELM